MARLENERRERAYRTFVTDCLGHLCGLNQRYADFVEPKNQKVETRTADEIKEHIKGKLAKLGGE